MYVYIYHDPGSSLRRPPVIVFDCGEEAPLDGFPLPPPTTIGVGGGATHQYSLAVDQPRIAHLALVWGCC